MRIGMNLPGPFWVSTNIGGRRRRRSRRRAAGSGSGCPVLFLIVVVIGLAAWLIQYTWWLLVPAFLAAATYTTVKRMEARK